MPKRLSTEKKREIDKALIVGVRRAGSSRRQMELSLAELTRLIDTAGGEVVAKISQEIKRIDPVTFIGSGKVLEVRELAEAVGADTIVIDDEISPVQNRNLEKEIGLFVIDRTAVILDIFAMRAQTKEGRLQVELAQMEYLAPRLVGRGELFSQQVGRIGTRGPGETALEYDRRSVRNRISHLRGQLEGVRKHRRIHRMKRESVPIPLVSLVGYTNAGKSTLMNALTGAGVFVEDKLFATLDPTVRKLRLPSGRIVLLADTVGFIRRLPHELVESFKATFEEVENSYLLLAVVDGSDEEAPAQLQVVRDVLSELEMSQKPLIEVVNKSDLPSAYRGEKSSISVSARTGAGVEELLGEIERVLRIEFRRTTLRLPMERGDILSKLYSTGHVFKSIYEGDCILVECELHQKYYQKYRRYAVNF